MSLNTCCRRVAAPVCRFSRLSSSQISRMPLRARVTNPSPAFAGRPTQSARAASSTTAPLSGSRMSEEIRELPEDEVDDVLFNSHYGVRTITLNRPKKLNSLNGSMARKIIPRLQEWSKSQLANVIVIKGEGRAFCAGGDVAALAKWNTEGSEGQKRSSDYFALEYKLDHLIATYSKPYVAFMDGITMGGGVGLSVHAPFRIATENTVYAMPETTIGFFPDVGASFFLTRMDGSMGTYLALTSEQLKGVDAFYHGVATHYIHSSSLPDLEARLAELEFKDYMTTSERYKIIDSTIEEFVTGLPSPRPAISGALRKKVDDVFSRESVESILSALKEEQSSEDEDIKKWANKTLSTINERSPTSVMVARHQMRVGHSWNIAEAFQHEHNIASKFMAHPDFVEGVTARLVRRQKERPNWQPNTFESINPDSIEQDFFSDRPSLPLLTYGQEAMYKEYPHMNMGSGDNQWATGLPSEADILRFLRAPGKNKTKEEVLSHFMQMKDEKMGVKEKVDEVLERKAEIGNDGNVVLLR